MADEASDTTIEIEIPVPEKPKMPSMVDDGVLSHALSQIVHFGTQNGDLRQKRFDQLGADAGSMWAVGLTSPTMMTALGQQVARESGSGRTRSETNLPAATSAAGNA